MTTPRSVRLALLAKTEIALLDVRHESRFAPGHPLFAASFPLGHLEAQAAQRLPRRGVPIVVYGDGADDAAAARRLGELGYTDVSLLADGLAGWAADGGELFKDVNAPSKAFGELVAETAGTPSLAADEVAALLRAPAPRRRARGGAARARRRWSSSMPAGSMSTRRCPSRPPPACRGPSWHSGFGRWRPSPAPPSS